MGEWTQSSIIHSFYSLHAKHAPQHSTRNCTS